MSQEHQIKKIHIIYRNLKKVSRSLKKKFKIKNHQTSPYVQQKETQKKKNTIYLRNWLIHPLILLVRYRNKILHFEFEHYAIDFFFNQLHPLLCTKYIFFG